MIEFDHSQLPRLVNALDRIVAALEQMGAARPRPHDAALAALQVIATTPHIAEYLRTHDPNALQQVATALLAATTATLADTAAAIARQERP